MSFVILPASGNAFISLIVCLVLLSESAICDIATDGLVAYYPFNGNANDESGNGNNGVVHGATLTPDRFGNANRAYYFDGIGDYIDISYAPLLDIGFSDYSIVVWTRFNVTQPNARWFSHSSYVGGYMMRTDDSGTSVFLEATASNQLHFQLSGIVPVNDNIWHFICGVVTRTTDAQIYVDGASKVQKRVSTSAYNLSNGLNARIGMYDQSLTEAFNGCLDDIRLYNRALAQVEITALYHEPNALTQTPTASPEPSCSGKYICSDLDYPPGTVSGNFSHFVFACSYYCLCCFSLQALTILLGSRA